MTDLRVIRWGIFDEPASSLFSFLSMIIFIYLSIKYFTWTNNCKRKNGAVYIYSPIWKFGLLAWIWCFFWSGMFHMHDTFLTETLDYFSAVFCLFYTFSASVICLSSLTYNQGIGFAAVMVTIYFRYCYYMRMVEFDYGWNMLLSVSSLGGTIIIWVVWALLYRRKHAWRVAVFVGSVFALGWWEMIEFERSIFGVFDTHSMWHASMSVIIPLFYSAVFAETNYWIDQQPILVT